MKGKKMHGWEVIWPDPPESVPGTNCDSSFPSTMLFSWSILPLRLKTDTHLLKAFSLKTACHHPTCWSLQLPAVLVAEVSKWALHNPQKAESTKLNWTISDNKLSWSVFSMLITQCSHAPFSWQSCKWGQLLVLVKQKEAVWKERQGSLSSTWATLCYVDACPWSQI